VLLLDYSLLKQQCEDIVNIASVKNFRVFNALQILMLTGIRISELYFENWSQIDDENWKLYCSKTKSTRYFKSDNLPLNFRLGIIENNYDNFRFEQSTLNSYKKSYITQRFKTAQEHLTSWHIFRYLYTRRLYYEQQKTVQEIKTTMSHASVSITSNYIFNNIYLL